jgi:DNA-directed RNA polymerase subunit M/transcription elongation factor TFIIS
VLIFKTPTCQSCGSFLTRKTMNEDTAKNGCGKCQRSRPAPSDFPNPDDIPF